MSQNFKLRVATTSDVFEMIRVWHLDLRAQRDEPIFTNLPDLTAALGDPQSLWMLLEVENQVEGFIWVMIDPQQRLAKIKEACVNQTVPCGRDHGVHLLVESVVEKLKANPATVDVLYTTMRPLAYQKDLAQEIGFKVLGIFPNGKEIDSSVVNSLTAYYFHQTLQKNRTLDYSLHPVLMPLFDIVSQECDLPKVTTQPFESKANKEFDVLPKLDVMKASTFVAHRFEVLRQRQALSSQFYPFLSPNALLTDLNQSIEVFVKIFEQNSMAMIVGERLELGVNPVELYKTVAHLLRQQGIFYVEMINDAADIQGTEALIQAGYLPCAFFPALKKQNNIRRDYVVFARSFENFFYPDLSHIAPVYKKYLQQYYNYEKSVYHRFIL